MKAKVIKGFIDKYSHEEFFPGERIEVTEKRLEELEGFVVILEETEEGTQKPEETDAEEEATKQTSGRKKTS